MKLTGLAFVLVWAVNAQQQQAPAPCLDSPPATRPYTRLRLMDVVRDQTPLRAEYLIRTCGIRIPFTKELEADLKEAEAEESVIAAVRDVAPKPPPRDDVVPADPNKHAGPTGGEVITNDKDGQRYVFIPPGKFTMGCESEIADGPCLKDEFPAQEVRITRGFWMGQTEVTAGAYKRFSRATGRAMPNEPEYRGIKLNAGWANENLPMVMVDWNDAVAFCEWAGGLGLPTEAQWEYAARAGSKGKHYSTPLTDIAWFGDNSGARRIDSAALWAKSPDEAMNVYRSNNNRPHEVGQKSMNQFKLYDMLGNVWEWTADWYQEKYESGRTETNPESRQGGQFRVVRGGSWFNVGAGVRALNRLKVRPLSRTNVFGFRCQGGLRFP